MQNYSALTTHTTHVFSEIGDYVVELTICSSISCSILNTTITIEPELDLYLRFNMTYTPGAVPLDINVIILYIKSDLSVPISVNCSIIFEQKKIANIITTDANLTTTSLESQSIHVVMTTDYVINYTYTNDVPDEILNMTCHNHVSSIQYDTTVLLRGEINTINITAEREAYLVGENVRLLVDIRQGDHVVLVIDFGDGIVDNFTRSNIYSNEFTWKLDHVYDTNENFTLFLYGYNEHFNSTVSMIQAPIIVQNGLTEIELTVDNKNVIFPNGLANFDLHAIDNSILPDNVFCSWKFDDFTESTVYSAGLMSGLSDIKQHLYHRHNIGSSISVFTYCYNLVSSKNASVEIQVYEEIHTLAVTATPIYAIPLENVSFVSSLVNGSNVIFDYDYNNGQMQSKHHDSLFANSKAFPHIYAFLTIGNFTVNITAKNPVSSVSYQLEIIVQNKILNLTISNLDSILYTPGWIQFVLATGYEQKELGNIHCAWNYTDGAIDKSYIHVLLPLGSHNHSHTFPRSSVGLVNISVTCENLVSSLVASTDVLVILDEVLLESLVTESWLWWTNTSTFNLTVKRFGTNSCFEFNLGDGTKYFYGVSWCQTYAAANGLSLIEIQHGQMTIELNHTYSTWNVYPVSVYAFNHITNDTINTTAVIKDWYCYSPNITYNESLINLVNIPQFMKSITFSIAPIDIEINCMKSLNKSQSLLVVYDNSNTVVYSEANMTEFSYTPRMFPYGMYRLVLRISMLGVEQYFDEVGVSFEIIKTPLVVNIAGKYL